MRQDERPDEHPVWDFFASVKLALVLISLLALTSIIGTVIQQGRPPGYYLLAYGPTLAGFFQALELTNMYQSWWFISLLLLFAVNLAICSLDRLPRVWRLVTRDHLATDPARLTRMPLRTELALPAAPVEAAGPVAEGLAAAGWQSRRREREEGVLLFAQKGAWSRLGAYVIHLGILLILAGALVGAVFGYKGTVMFPEGVTIDRVFEGSTERTIPLDFQLHLENFAISYYPNGMVREFRSDVVLLDPELDGPLETDIRVNHPLKHRGVTFYQASYQPRPEFYVTLSPRENDRPATFEVVPGQPVRWPEEEVTFQVDTPRTDDLGRVHEFRISLASPGAEPTRFAMRDLQTVTVARPAGDYLFHIRQRYATGLQVARDPGVWIVYAGFALMAAGLYVTFMVAHRRIWILLSPDGAGGTRLLLAGGSNRNRESFDRRYAQLVEGLRRDTTGQP